MRVQWNRIRRDESVENVIYGAMAAYFCPECGNEIYGEWEWDPLEIHEAINKEKFNLYCQKKHEALEFIFLEECPCCGGKLRRTDGYFHQAYFGIDEPPEPFFAAFSIQSQRLKPTELNQMFYYMDELRAQSEVNEIRTYAEEKFSLFLDNVEMHSKTELLDQNQDSETNLSTEELSRYLQRATKLEANILELSTRLKELYKQEYKAKRMKKGEKAELIYSVHDKVINAKSQLEKYMNQLDEITNSSLNKVEITRPEPPQEPVYRSAFLFNKKQIEEDNCQKKKEYELQLAKYQEELSAIDVKEAQLIEEEKKKRKEQISSIKDKIDVCNEEIKILQVKEDSIQKEIKKRTDLPMQVVFNALNHEISIVEKTLCKMIFARDNLYSLNIVYKKYCNFIAMATISEYFLTSRCTSLEGPNGAYNLYELEMRANTIITQLSRIEDNLEKIKETQYVLYSELHELNRNTKRMQDLLDVSIQSVNNNLNNLSNVAEIIAYNTSVDAYYSKMLTDMIANMRIYGFSISI